MNSNKELKELEKTIVTNYKDDVDSVQSLIDQRGAISELIKKVSEHRINAADLMKQLKSCNEVGRAVADNLDSHNMKVEALGSKHSSRIAKLLKLPND